MENKSMIDIAQLEERLGKKITSLNSYSCEDGYSDIATEAKLVVCNDGSKYLHCHVGSVNNCKHVCGFKIL